MIAAIIGYKYGHSDGYQLDMEAKCHPQYYERIMKLEKESSSCSSRHESLIEGCKEYKEKLHKCQVDFENIREEYTKVRMDLTECRTGSELRRITAETESNDKYSKLEKKLGDCRQALESCSDNARSWW